MAKQNSKDLEQKVQAVDSKIESLQKRIEELKFDRQTLKDRLNNAYCEERLATQGIDLKVAAVKETNESGARFLVTFENGLQTWSVKRPKIGSAMRFTPDFVKLMEECRDAKAKAEASKQLKQIVSEA